MAGFNLLDMLGAFNLRMMWNGARHQVRGAVRMRSSEKFRYIKEPLPPAAYRTVKSITLMNRSATLVQLASEHRALQVQALHPQVLEIRLDQGGAFPERFSYCIDTIPADWGGALLTTTETGKIISLATDVIALHIEKESGALTLETTGGLTLSGGAGVGVHSSGALSLEMGLPASAAVYGLGEKAFSLNLRGQALQLYNRDPAVYTRGDDPIYANVPFWIMLDGDQCLGVYIDNTYPAWMDTGSRDARTMHYQASGGDLAAYFITGTPAEVLAHYTTLTGRIELPPVWILGAHLSRWSYYPQARVLEIAKQARQNRIPADVIHIDIDYMDGWRCFTIDQAKFPDISVMHDQLHDQGFKSIAIIDPGIKIDPAYPVYQSGVAGDHFIIWPDGQRFTGPVWPGDCHFPDFSRPQTREWWGTQYQTLLEKGFDSFWNDMNEPAIIAPIHGAQIPGDVQHDYDGRGADHEAVHNLYGLLMSRATQEGLAKLRPDRRSAVLTRATWAGGQRYAMHWTGDNTSEWDSLRLAIPMALNLGLSGIPITGPDIGGFAGRPSAELVTRWIQACALFPFFRVHTMAGMPDQEPWVFGEPYTSINRKFIELRYRLLPALYTAMWHSSRTGTPMIRPLWFNYPGQVDPDIDDQYLLGDSLLVAPVIEESTIRRAVALPPGTWYDFWTGEAIEGGRTIHVDAGLDHLPLYARAGIALPTWPVQQYIGEAQIDELTVTAYRGKGVSLLYEDDGLSSNYTALDRHRITEYHVTQNGVSRRIHSGMFRPAYGKTTVIPIGYGDHAQPATETADEFSMSW